MVSYHGPHYSLGCGIRTHEVNLEFSNVQLITYESGAGHAQWKAATYAGFGARSIFTSVSTMSEFLSLFPVVSLTSSQVYSVKRYHEKAGFAPAAGACDFSFPLFRLYS
jgi:hypothetical protein